MFDGIQLIFRTNSANCTVGCDTDFVTAYGIIGTESVSSRPKGVTNPIGEGKA
jgi:hypothetical protein